MAAVHCEKFGRTIEGLFLSLLALACAGVVITSDVDRSWRIGAGIRHIQFMLCHLFHIN